MKRVYGLLITLLIFLWFTGTRLPVYSSCGPIGDANCDGNVNMSDFEIFRKEYLGEATTTTADFNADGQVSVADFEIWRSNWFNSSSASPTPTNKPSAKSYYVAPTGNDANVGTPQSPLRTIAKAVTLVKSGEEIHILPGTYSERLQISGKSGTPTAPIVLVGESQDPAQYPVIDGGDSVTTGTAWASSTPAVTVSGSSWWVFERLKIANSSPASFFLDGAGYIVIRRTIMNYHRYGVLSRNKSHHILMEYNTIYQSYGYQPWSAIKSSKWEGGAYTSFYGGGYITIRNNYIHDSFNGVYLFRSTDAGKYVKAPYTDANVWIYRNRFENILDDPYEPDQSYAFNNHFFENTLINTHRMVSMASGNTLLPDSNLGPVYVYDNVQLTTNDITKEASSRGSYNSAWKVELNVNFFSNGIFMFNNSIDTSQPANGTGIHFLNGDGVVNNWHHMNNAYRTRLQTATSPPSLKNSSMDNDITSVGMGYTESAGKDKTDPGFTDSLHENFHLTSSAAARGMSQGVSFKSGFATSQVIPAGADAGAFQYGETDFRKTPAPRYEVPPGGEDASFGATTYPWPPDERGGINPPNGPLTAR